MKNRRQFFPIFILLSVLWGCVSENEVAPPEPVGPVPSERQLAWHDLQYYAFIHFNMNTFTNMEWGTGAESPEQFDPKELDTRQWARVAKEAGMRGIILTAKHHDGFCLWPTKTTKHSVKNSPWRNGEGDVVKELAEACKEYGLKFGIYLSPWDRNNEHYGNPEYVAIFHEQLRELLTNYGPVFEVWFDGANGGSGYYGGTNETRKIDNKTYYEWDKTNAIVRELQPDAVIFSDGGPDVRWVGTEEGWANETNWSIMRRDEISPGWERYVELRSGHEDGTHWLPAEVNTSIRPGWYYHPGEDHQVKSLARLVQTYYESIGRNANFLLNLPVDDRGLIHEKDASQLMALREQIDKDFADELAHGKEVTAGNVRGESSKFAADNVNDQDPKTYWATDDDVHSSTITIGFDKPTEVNRILLQEYIQLGQRVKRFKVQAEVEGKWNMIDEQTTIGYKRILRFETVKATKIKVSVLDAKAALAISNIELYKAPNLLVEPEFQRNRDGYVELKVPEDDLEMYYSLDGSEPKKDSDNSVKYKDAFLVEQPGTLRAIAVDPETGDQSSELLKHLDIPRKNWKILQVSSGSEKSELMLDGDPSTYWISEQEVTNPQEILIDLGEVYDLEGFTYWPNQDRYPKGIVTHYEFLAGTSKEGLNTVASGEFGNVVNNRIEQKVEFKKIPARYIKFRAVKTQDEGHQASIAELHVITN